MPTLIMKDLGPSWDETTIALLLGMSTDDVRVERLGQDPDNDHTHAARLSFRTERERRTIVRSYQGLVIPMTHGYHYYTFVDDEGKLLSVEDDDDDDDRDHEEDIMMMESPPLHLQLMALPPKELESRFHRLCETSWHDTLPYPHHKTKDRVHAHAAMAYQLTKTLQENKTHIRPIRYCRGVPVPSRKAIDVVLNYLRSFSHWPPAETQRKGVSASNYLIIKQHHHPPEHDELWNMCRHLLHLAVPGAVYNALAITRGFRGSPHIDKHDTTFQYVIALGDFVGGHLCCEADVDGTETLAIDIHERVGRMDGRRVHWVDGWRGGDRYSIVYYCTEERDGTEREVSQACHRMWMEEHPRQDVRTGKVPRRTYGSSSSGRLPPCLPMIGLGCSSFSTFFSSAGDDDDDDDDDDLTADTITRDIPVVQGWIDTIRHAVLDRGIFLLDTAPWYGHGTSEIVVGYALDTILINDEGFDAIRDYSDHVAVTAGSEEKFSKPKRRERTGLLPRSSVIVNTKVGRYEADPLHQFDFSYSTTIKSVFRSLERMNCEYIDVLQLHDPEFAPSMSILLEETIPALLECRKRGWAKAIGLTGYPLEVQHEILVKCSEQFGGDGLVFDQSLVYCHSNLHDMSLFHDSCFQPRNHDPSTSETEPNPFAPPPLESLAKNITFAEFCQSKGINLMAAAPLSMGLLTDSGPPVWHPASSSLKAACADAARLCRSNGVNISSLAMMYSISQPGIGCTLIGMKDVNEVDVASDLAMRFSSIDFDEMNTMHQHDETNPILERILTANERKTCLQLLDKKHGPFANVWASGDYRWDGKAEAAKFWLLVNQLEAGRTQPAKSIVQ